MRVWVSSCFTCNAAFKDLRKRKFVTTRYWAAKEKRPGWSWPLPCHPLALLYYFFFVVFHFVSHQSTTSTKRRDVPQNLINQEVTNCHVPMRHFGNTHLWSCDYCVSLKGSLPGDLYFKDQRIFFLSNWPKLLGTSIVRLGGLSACSRAWLVIYFFRALASLPFTYGVLHRPSDAKARAFVNLSIFLVCWEWIICFYVVPLRGSVLTSTYKCGGNTWIFWASDVSLKRVWWILLQFLTKRLTLVQHCVPVPNWSCYRLISYFITSLLGGRRTSLSSN